MQGAGRAKDYYRTLELSEGAGQEEVRRAFRRLAIQYHPDKNPGSREWAEARFKEINEAYGVLSDPARRRQYDLQRRAGFPGVGAGRGGAYQGDVLRTFFSDPHFYQEVDRLFRDLGLRFDREFVDQVFFSGRGTFFHFFGSPSTFSYRVSRSGASPRQRAAASPTSRGAGGPRSRDGQSWLAGLAERFAVWLGKQLVKRLAAAEPAAQAETDGGHELVLTPEEARLGCEKRVRYVLDGQYREVAVTIPAAVRDGTRVRLRGLGDARARTGDVYLRVRVRGAGNGRSEPGR